MNCLAEGTGLKELMPLLEAQMQALLEPVMAAPMSVSEGNGDTSLPIISMPNSLRTIYGPARLELADNRRASLSS
jgi:hypothetical protein